MTKSKDPLVPPSVPLPVDPPPIDPPESPESRIAVPEGSSDRLPDPFQAVCLLSGGMDSVTLLAMMSQEYHYRVTALWVDYGQRHAKEVESARFQADRYHARLIELDLESLGPQLVSSLVPSDRSGEIPQGHYSAETMKSTVVPGRNMMLLSIAWGINISLGGVAVGTAVHAGDHVIYPDCRPEFIRGAEVALSLGTDGLLLRPPVLFTPFLQTSKSAILRKGLSLGVDYEHTWSCYAGGSLACGRCGTCVERLEAFYENGISDPLPYADREYFLTVIKGSHS